MSLCATGLQLDRRLGQGERPKVASAAERDPVRQPSAGGDGDPAGRGWMGISGVGVSVDWEITYSTLIYKLGDDGPSCHQAIVSSTYLEMIFSIRSSSTSEVLWLW